MQYDGCMQPLHGGKGACSQLRIEINQEYQQIMQYIKFQTTNKGQTKTNWEISDSTHNSSAKMIEDDVGEE